MGMQMLLSLIAAILVQDVAEPVTLPRTERVVWESETLEGERSLQIAGPILPSPEGTELPILIVLDGDVMFGMAAETARLMSFEGSPPPLVVAGVSYGGLNQWIAQRQIDYHPQAEGPGIEEFTAALIDEALPLIRSAYPTATGPVFVFGHSSGGLVALEAAFHPEVTGVIASSASLEEEPEWATQLAARFAETPPAANVYLSSGSEEADNRVALEAFRTSGELSVEVHIIPEGTHMSVIPGVFARGLRAMFEAN